MAKPITREDLSKLYDTKSVKDICKELDVSIFGFYSLLDEAKIPRKKKHTKRTKWTLVE